MSEEELEAMLDPEQAEALKLYCARVLDEEICAKIEEVHKQNLNHYEQLATNLHFKLELHEEGKGELVREMVLA